MAGIETGARVVAAHDLLRDDQVPIKKGCPGKVVAISAYFTSIYTVEFAAAESRDGKVTVNRLRSIDLRKV